MRWWARGSGCTGAMPNTGWIASGWSRRRRGGRLRPAMAGAVLLLRAGPGQLHLAIRVSDGIVHADAGLRRVAWRPGTPPWPVLGCWKGEG